MYGCSVFFSPSSVTMIKKSMAFYSSKLNFPRTIPQQGPHSTHFMFPGRTFYARDPSDPAGSAGKSPSEFPNRAPGYQPNYPVEVPQLPDDPDLEPVAPPEIIADPPPTRPGQNPDPDFPVPPTTPPPKPDIPIPPPDWTPPPPGEPSPPTPDPPAGPGIVF
uniref:Uncharacterized protein n=1 Tax=Kalanchoe fedtschenkoi TaxID=63787 RepID=A0A7N1A7Z2_KALFE